MNKSNDLINDPIFKDLRKFAAKQPVSSKSAALPANILNEFRANAAAPKPAFKRRRVTGGVFVLIFAGIALPSLSYANVLPAPISNVVKQVVHSNVVKQVVHFVATPVRVITQVVSPTENNPATDGQQNAPTIVETSTASGATTNSIQNPANSQIVGSAGAPNNQVANPGNPANPVTSPANNGSVKSNSVQNNSGQNKNTSSEKKSETATAQTKEVTKEIGRAHV